VKALENPTFIPHVFVLFSFSLQLLPKWNSL